MEQKKYFFAVDLGATSGRTIIGDITLCQAHDKATEVEDLLRSRYGEDTHIAVHVEPK